MKGSIIGLDAINGCPMKIKDVKLVKAGGHFARHEITVEPYNKPFWEDARKKIEYYEDEIIRHNGYSFSFEIPKPVPLDKIFGF